MYLGIFSKLYPHLPQSLVIKIAKFIVKNIINKYANIEVQNESTLTEVKGPIIFVCNHLSNSDALILNHVLVKHDLTFVAGVKLSNTGFTNLGQLALKTTPIKPDSVDTIGLSKIVKILKSDSNILIFPEGTRSRSGSMIEGKKGFLLLKRFSKAKIVPIGITGTENLLPINDDDMSKEKFHKAQISIKIGNAIEYPPKENSETKKEYDDRLLSYTMRRISELLPKEYRGHYF